MDFKILNWNIGGARYLQLEEEERTTFKRDLNEELRKLIVQHRPHVVTLQEIVRYGTSSNDAQEIVDPIPDYMYYSFPLIDTYRLSAEAKWRRVRERGRWPDGSYFAQGNAFLFQNGVPHYPVWSLSATNADFRTDRHYVEQVNLELGLYFGDRSSEPRAALVSHFIFKPDGEDGSPLDVFVINLHLTTLMMEREGIPKIDAEASRIRLNQLETVFFNIVSQYNVWRQQGYPIRGKPRQEMVGETYERYEPVWVVAGDFNFTEESDEYRWVTNLNFIDVCPNKGKGTKAKGLGAPPTLTVDYIFAGPKFLALDPLIAADAIRDNPIPASMVKVTARLSDHYPLFANIPLAIG